MRRSRQSSTHPSLTGRIRSEPAGQGTHSSRYRNYRLIWTGAFLSSIGTWTQDVALSWLIHTRLHDPFYLGLRAFASDAPLLTFMLVGGAAADRLDRRLILFISNTIQMTLPVAAANRLSGRSDILGGPFDEWRIQ